MVEKIDFVNGKISNFKGLVTSTCTPNFIEIGRKKF